MQPTSAPRVAVALDDPGDVATVVRLANIAGVAAAPCAVPELAEAWRSAAGVVLDEAASRRCVAARVPRRERVLLVTAGEAGTPTWRDALALGAEQVLPLSDEAQVAAWLAALTEREAAGRLVCCLSARGGAGASTLAAAVGLAAAVEGEALLLDGDLHGGGIDYLLGVESVEGARWPELYDTTGLLPAAALSESLPAAGGLRVVAARGGPAQPPTASLAAVVEAGLRGHRVVVADVRRGGPTSQVWLSYADTTLLVVPCEVRAALAAAAWAREAAGRCGELRLVVRPGPGDLRADDVAAAVGAPVVALWPWERRLSALTESGGFCRGWRRSRVGGIATTMVRELIA